jgi:hypothetical protein
MNIAFLTETNFEGKWPLNFTNARTEICWQFALDSYHHNIWNYNIVKGYDHVFVIVPKGDFHLNAIGCKLVEKENWLSKLLKTNFTEVLKNNNKKVHFVQEGTTSMWNDMSVEDQFYYYNHLNNFDVLFAHNNNDRCYYAGMFPTKKVSVIPTLMYTNLLDNIKWTPENKVMIGGNFSRFYGGFQSYIISDIFQNCQKWTMDSHSKREDESSIPDLNHLPRISWVDWIKTLSTFKYAVHMMPIYAAGTFMLNCAYIGIPCVAPSYTDTQKTCFPDFNILNAEDIQSARHLAEKLYLDRDYYNLISNKAIELSRNSVHINVDKWREHIYSNI